MKHRSEEQVEVSDLVGGRVKTVREGRGWSRKRLAEECAASGRPWIGVPPKPMNNRCRYP